MCLLNGRAAGLTPSQWQPAGGCPLVTFSHLLVVDLLAQTWLVTGGDGM